MKQEEFIYPGAIDNISKILKYFNVENIFLVHGKQSYIKSGAYKSLNSIYTNYKVTEFCEFCVNPKLAEAEIGYKEFKQSNSQLIIAVGGGSVIDMAKIIKYLGINGEIPNNKDYTLPIVAIPTTAGTGSEATHFAVVYIDGTKHSYEKEYLLPEVAIVDANLLDGQSKYQMAVSGLDAFAQGIESFWSIKSTRESQKYSLVAIEQIWENLENAINGDKSSRENIAKGAFYAGKAINITKTTGPHALSYYITSKFNIPHGHAVALFLPIFYTYNLTIQYENCIDPRGHLFVKAAIEKINKILGIQSEDNGAKKIHDFIQCVGLINDFKKLNLNIEDIKVVLENVNEQRFLNNPRKFEKISLMKIIKPFFQ